MKMLFYGETPAIETGAGQLSKYLLQACKEASYDMMMIGLNHHVSLRFKEAEFPYHILPAPSHDMYNLDNAKYFIRHDEYDMLFLTGDINILDELMESVAEARKYKKFQLIALPAIDSDIFNRSYLRCLLLADIPVVFSRYAHHLACKLAPDLTGRLRVIRPGCDPETFHPLPEEERQKIRQDMFGCDPETFLVVNVNRNQYRKDLARSMAAFHLFHRKQPNSSLYLHAKQEDLGGHLPTQALLLGLRVDANEIIFAPEGYNEVQGISRAALNGVYNAADVCISTSTGEGWGLTTTECMAAGTPFIGPKNTTFQEILEDDRGYLVASGGENLWTIPYGLSQGPREIVSVTAMSEALEHVFYNMEEAQARAKKAREWAMGHTWKGMISEWLGFLSPLS